MAKWIDCTLSDLGTIIGGATPSTKMEENYQNGHIPWITPKDLSVFRGRYISHGERNITQQGLKSCSTQLLPKHSILFSSRAPIGYIAIAECELCTNQGFKSIVPNERTDYMFLYYLLKFNKNAIENMGSGTTFKEVSGSTMKSIPVRVPVSIEEQKRIASTLSALDDKIEENDEYFEDAGRFVIEREKASIGMLQRNFRIGFNRAGRIIDQLSEAGVVGPDIGTKPRKVLITMQEFDELLSKFR